ncbi:MAG: hypothetical protein GXO76_15580 [Calditrichaeota bacterium]|nr:hypothetical protein [Calditrichota bacterium]
MPFAQLDRTKLHIKPLSERKNKVVIERDAIPLNAESQNHTPEFVQTIEEAAARLRQAREKDASRMLAIGAHTIKNGLGPVLIRLMESGWITHLATNGAGIIHDWEFAFQGKSSEDVRANVAVGQFGIWEETGRYINLALVVGAFEGKGYGESVGSMIHHEGVHIPSAEEIRELVLSHTGYPYWKAAAALDLLEVIETFNLPSGWLDIPFPYKKYCVQAAAYRLGIPFTGHPMIGHDIIYTHPMNHGAAVGRTALRDFLTFANSVNRLEYGVYLSVGSAVMSPMIFEKSLSMAQNLHLQAGSRIEHHYMLIVDLAKNDWDWSRGEPPQDTAAYYLRYLKTFSRMGGTMRYLTADNRDFFLALLHELER